MRGDLALIVKQQSLTGFNVKLTLLGLLECPYGDRSGVYFINLQSAVDLPGNLPDI